MEILSFKMAVKVFGGSPVTEWKVIPERMVYGYLKEVAVGMTWGMSVASKMELRSRMEEKLTECSERIWGDLWGAVLWRLEERTPRYFEKVRAVLIQLALQVGTVLKYRALAKMVAMDHQTVRFYVEFLMAKGIVFGLWPEEESKEGFRVYFYDCGLRNALIGDFRPLEKRQDVQGLWENFVIAEQMKKVRRNAAVGVVYYYRGGEVLSLVEKRDGRESELRVEWMGDDVGVKVDRRVVCWQNVLRFI